jgi:autotransporter-associated beta strand protein
MAYKKKTHLFLLSTLLISSILQSRPALAQRVLGLDVSAWQGNISQATWNNIRNLENRQFVFLRASRGGTTGFYNQSNAGNNNPPGQNTLSQRYDDPYFVQNINRATAAGIYSGSYHFSRPDIIESTLNSEGIANTGTDEADHFIQMAGAWMRPGYLVPVHDFEAGSGARTNNQLTQFCIDFSDRIFEIMQIRPAIYFNGQYANILQAASANLRQQVVQKNPILWSARYPNQSNPDAINVQDGHPKDSVSTIYGPWDDYGVTHPWQFWQYASTGRLQSYNNGNSNLDFNVCQGDIEYLKDTMVPAVWIHDNDGQWTDLANWNCGLSPIVPVTGPGQVAPIGQQTLPTPRLPGISGFGIAGGENDTVILDRPNANITVTHSSGVHNIRKLFVKEQLEITGGSLIVNYNPDYQSDVAGFPNALRSGSVSATFSSPVTLSGNGSLSVHTLEVDPQASFRLGGEAFQFCRVFLQPDVDCPARILLTDDVRLFPHGTSAMHVASCGGRGKSGTFDLGGENRKLTVGNISQNALLTISVPVVNGGLIKDGPGTLALTGNSTYAGDTTVLAGTLRTNGYGLSPHAAISISEQATLQLDYDGLRAIRALSINGLSLSQGTWGAVGSKAENQSPRITGTGILEVRDDCELANAVLL